MVLDGAALSPVRELGPHRAAWDALVAAQPTPSPFARSWWLEAMAAHLPAGVAPLHLLVHHGDRLVGGIALTADRLAGVRRHRFLGQGVLAPDHLDLLALPGAEDAVVAAFAGWFTRPGARLLHLDGVDDTALVRRAAPGWSRPIEAAPWAPLPGSGEAFTAGLSATFRRSLRRSARRLAAAGHEHQRVAPADTGRALAAFWALHRGRGDRDRLLAERAVLDAAVHAGVARGECRLDVLGSPEAPAAVAISFEVGQRLSLYQVARSVRPEDASAGTVLLAAVIADAASHGCREVDLLRGEETYKQHFAAATRAMLVHEASHGAPAGLLVHGRRAAVGLRARRAGRVGSSV